MSSFYENLLSIESSDGDDYDSSLSDTSENGDDYGSHGSQVAGLTDLAHLHETYDFNQTEEEFQAKINDLKTHSVERFKNKWDEILEKYSKIDDEKESDEIDIISGKIIKDNGHLRSLSSINSFTSRAFDGNIWAMTHDLDRELQNKHTRNSRLRKKKRELKAMLKRQESFYNASLQEDVSPIKAEAVISRPKDNSDPFEDNLLSLKPSPTKKSRTMSDKNNSLFEKPKNDPLYILTPTKQTPKKSGRRASTGGPAKKLFPIDSSHLNKQPSFHKSGEIASSLNTNSFIETGREWKLRVSKNSQASNHDATHDTDEAHVKSISFDSNDTSSIRYNEKPDESIDGMDKNNSSVNESHTDTFDATSSPILLYLESCHSAISLDFDDQFLIVTETCLQQEETESGLIYHCAFEDCEYCTGNKTLYQNHLLQKHEPQLAALGYPISLSIAQHTNNQIALEVVRKLTRDFPLVHEVPQLPLTKDGNPYICNQDLGQARYCKKIFLHKSDLRKHQRVQPLSCSSKKQVLLCPMLGCGYMTDMGYLEWRQHFIDSRHHVAPEHRGDKVLLKTGLQPVHSPTNREPTYHSNSDGNTENPITISSSTFEGISKYKLAEEDTTQESLKDKETKMTRIDLIEEISSLFDDSSSDVDGYPENPVSLERHLTLKSSRPKEFTNIELISDSQRQSDYKKSNFPMILDESKVMKSPTFDDTTGYESIDEIFS